MRLIEFSVTNYRSITKAHKITLQNLTILIGKNNEGKSNLLTALNVAMKTLLIHCRSTYRAPSFNRSLELYDWERDFPIQFQQRKSGLESIFKLKFYLDEDERHEFKINTGIKGNAEIPIIIRYNKDRKVDITVPKKGTSAYNKKSQKVAKFISDRIAFNYIQTVRTEGTALDALRQVIIEELSVLNDNLEYANAIDKINCLQQEILNKIAVQLKEPMLEMLPNLRDIQILKRRDEHLYRMRNDVDIIIDDGIPTNISFKGDGVKSLATMAILKDKRNVKAASIIAIEEPESHLHSGAIHSLVNVIHRISDNNQVIITTHNPLFVQHSFLKSTIIVNKGYARQAKSIAEIREILGVQASDNLKNANQVLIVEGECDKVTLMKILSLKSETLSLALKTNQLVINSLSGAGNLSHDLNDLKNCMCCYFVLMDNDESGNNAVTKAIEEGLLESSQFKMTICNGQSSSEFEDCIKKGIYEDRIKKEFSIDINVKEFKSKEKWSIRMKGVFLSQGSPWNEKIEKRVKTFVAEEVQNCNASPSEILIEQKSGFINSLVTSLEEMINNTK